MPVCIWIARPGVPRPEMVTRLHDVEGEVGDVEALGVQDGDAAAAEGIAPAGKLVQGLEMEFKKIVNFIYLFSDWVGSRGSGSEKIFFCIRTSCNAFDTEH